MKYVRGALRVNHWPWEFYRGLEAEEKEKNDATRHRGERGQRGKRREKTKNFFNFPTVLKQKLENFTLKVNRSQSYLRYLNFPCMYKSYTWKGTNNNKFCNASLRTWMNYLTRMDYLEKKKWTYTRKLILTTSLPSSLPSGDPMIIA